MATRDKIICATVFFVCLFASWAGLVFAGKVPADAFVAFLSTTLAGGCAAFLALLKPDKMASQETAPVSPSATASASPAEVEPVPASSPAPVQAPDAPAAPSQPSAASGATSAATVLKPTLTAAPQEAANA